MAYFLMNSRAVRHSLAYRVRIRTIEIERKKEYKSMPIASPKDVEKCLKGVDYPAKKQDLLKHAQDHGADQQVIETIKQLPEQNFEGPVGITKAIGEMDRRSGGTAH